MTAEKIKRILNGANIDYSGVVQIPELRTILLASNQGIDSRRDFIYFDFTNEMIKIKKYQPKRAAGKIGPCEIDDTKTFISGSVLSFYTSHKEYKYPVAQLGCVLFTVNKNTGNIVNQYDIIDAGLNFIQTAKPISYNKTTEYLCYSTKEDFGSMVQDEKDKSVFLKYTPMTENKYDIFLDMSYVLGFEFVSERVGNS